jgi:hypothetical protein
MAARAVVVPMKNFAARSVAFNEIRDVAEVSEYIEAFICMLAHWCLLAFCLLVEKLLVLRASGSAAPRPEMQAHH